MRLLLSNAQTMLAEYVDYGTCSTDPRVTLRINMVIERLLPALNPERTLGRYVFPLVSNTITLPRDIKTVLAAFIEFQQPPTNMLGTLCSCNLRQLVDVRSRWYEFLPGGPINFTGAAPNVLTDLGTGFSTFADITPDAPCRIRVYTDVPQPTIEGYVYVNALDPDGNPVQSLDAGLYRNVDMIAVPIQGQNYVDSVVAYSQVFSINKDPTISRVKLYAINDALPTTDPNYQTPIAVYAPDELAPDYRRYQLNWCLPADEQDQTKIVVIAKRYFVPTTDPDADLIITSMGALKNGLQALKYEDAGSDQLADSHWKRALAILDTETKDYDGDYKATPQIQSSCWGGADIWNLH